MTDDHVNSLAPVAQLLIKSRRVWRWARWLLIIGVPYASGWVSGKLSVKLEVAELQQENLRKDGQIRDLTTSLHTQDKLIQVITAELQPIRNDLRNVGRAVVQARQMAIAYESAALRGRKVEAGEKIGGAYDRILNDGKASVTGAIEQTWAKIGVP